VKSRGSKKKLNCTSALKMSQLVNTSVGLLCHWNRIKN